MARLLRVAIILTCFFSAGAGKAFAQGGACPSVANYWDAAGTTIVTLASLGVTHCYYASKSLGSDSLYDGTSEAVNGSHGPWAHVPGMTGCASNCAAVTPAAGNGFILRGGDTWGTSDLQLVYHGGWPSGTSSSWIYYGVDPGWFAGSSWTRPVFSCAGGACSVSAAGAYLYTGNGNSYIMWDNIEFTGFHEASMTTYVQGGGPHQIFENLYAHGWEHTGASSDSGVAYTSAYPNVTFRFSICDGSDTTKDMMQCMRGDEEYVYGMHMSYITDGLSTTTNTYIHDNWIGHIVGSFQGTGHANAILNESESSGDPAVFVYNNVMTDVQGGEGHYWLNQSAHNVAWYIFNNVLYSAVNSNNFNTCQLNGTNCGTWYIFNNTFECGSASGGVGVCANTAAIAQPVVQTWINNHCISSCTNGGNSLAIIKEDLAHELRQTLAQADANTSPHFDQYTETQTFPFSPVAATNSTVGVGMNEQALCATIAGLNAAAGAACQNSTGYACAYNTSNHAVTCSTKTANVRPPSGAWDIGAYQYSTAQGQTPQPPTSLQASVQ